MALQVLFHIDVQFFLQMIFQLCRHVEIDGALQRTGEVAALGLQSNGDGTAGKLLDGIGLLCVPGGIGCTDKFVGHRREQCAAIFLLAGAPTLELEYQLFTFGNCTHRELWFVQVHDRCVEHDASVLKCRALAIHLKWQLLLGRLGKDNRQRA
ncbi:hypothetical protein D3C73_1054870 [compost metagenome]